MSTNDAQIVAEPRVLSPLLSSKGRSMSRAETWSSSTYKRIRQLPRRIAAVTVLTVALFVLTVAISTFWMSQTLDRQARDQSVAQVSNLRANLLAKARVITLDYTKWDAAVDAIEAPNVPWIFDNIGTTAARGLAVQLVALWGGALDTDMGWVVGSDRDPINGIFLPEDAAMIEEHLAAKPLGNEDGIEFFGWYDGEPFVYAAARFEPVDNVDLWSAAAEHGQLVMGLRLSDAVLADFADSLALQHVTVTREAPSTAPSVPLLGLAGNPVGYLTWSQPQPGSLMLRKMLPALTIVTIITTCLATISMRLLGRSAQHLVLAEQQASVAARNDALTGLPNRTALNEAVAHPAKAGERAILFLDVDRFKRINDSQGHAAGDALIVGMSQRLAKVAGSERLLARIAGDEFVFLISGQNADRQTETLVKEVETAFTEPFDLLGHPTMVQASIGYAVQMLDDLPGHELLRQADLAMYEAKRLGQGPVVFCEALEQSSRDNTAVELALRAALTRPDEFWLAYQPITTAAGQMKHAEALARWTSPTLGSVPPDRFIRVAEQSGLIHELGWSLISRLCDDLLVYPNLRVSLNISPSQLMAPNFVADFTAQLAARSLSHDRIELEITESVLIDDSQAASQHLQELREAGFSIALDDFGTGYSSISYLEHLTFNTLKIDRSFASELRSSTKRHALIRCMIEMAHGLDLNVVCEGVETAEDLSFLQDLHCDLVQGYYMDKPLPIGALADRWLQTGRTQAAA
jgi:diguanylate cyclase (GGDEF)-like protein